jgi:hypothetical protein
VQPGLKGRVSFEPAVAAGQPTPMAAVRAVLASPKASYYPAYIRQPAAANNLEQVAAYHGNKRVYASYTPLDEDHDGVTIAIPEINDPQLAGRKFYICRGEKVIPPLPPGINLNTVVHLQPLPVATTFRGTVHFHNLKPSELGALLWALTLGERPGQNGGPTLHQKIGMGRPLGLGEVTIEIENLTVDWNDFRSDNRDLTTQALGFMSDFGSGMAAAYGDYFTGQSWCDSDQILALQNVSNPVKGRAYFAAIRARLGAGADEPVYMPLRNFQAAKTALSTRRPSCASPSRRPRSRVNARIPLGDPRQHCRGVRAAVSRVILPPSNSATPGNRS